jgi:hypothetical protein
VVAVQNDPVANGAQRVRILVFPRQVRVAPESVIRMLWASELEQERAFLQEELAQAEHKVTRLEHAISACQGCLEADGLAAMMHSAQLEQEILRDLIAHQAAEDALSLDTLILQQIKHFKLEAARLAHDWHRGHPTPAGYWEAESKQAFLTTLLRRFHAWHAGRPYYADAQPPSAASSDGSARAAKPEPDLSPTKGGVYLHPWYISAASGSGQHQGEGLPGGNDSDLGPLDALRHAIYAMLSAQRFPEHHLEIIAEPGGTVMVKGHAHSEEERSRIMATIGGVPGVQEMLVDIAVTVPQHCPICAAQGLQST